ncbi:MAG TPA: ATP synthase F1 subunit delta [Nitrospirota bacterium]|nr:ATP synthase F1 subunit delta [Nitrospirota bacterium]
MLKDIVARRYAKALLALASKSGETEAVKKDLSAVAEAFRTSKPLQSVVMNPIFSAKDKAKVVRGLAAELKVSPLCARFLDLLVKKGRFRYVREAAAGYADLLDIAQGRVKATVTSAAALSDDEVAKLKDRIKAVAGKEVELKVEVDPALIGGVRTRIGSTVYDGSIRNQVARVRDTLLK